MPSGILPICSAGEGLLLQGEHELKETAELVYQALAEYYDLFTDDRAALQEAIGAQLQEPYSEVGNTRILRHQSAIVGAYSCYLAEELGERQLVSLRMLLAVPNLKDNIFEQLQQFREQTSDVDPDSFYLARITVAERWRGAGWGRKLLADFEAEALARARRKVCLHVRRDNRPAIRVYDAAGYEVVSPRDLQYFTMRKLL